MGTISPSVMRASLVGAFVCLLVVLVAVDACVVTVPARCRRAGETCKLSGNVRTIIVVKDEQKCCAGLSCNNGKCEAATTPTPSPSPTTTTTPTTTTVAPGKK